VRKGSGAGSSKAFADVAQKVEIDGHRSDGDEGQSLWRIRPTAARRQRLDYKPANEFASFVHDLFLITVAADVAILN
jgi:hypothetical protein